MKKQKIKSSGSKRPEAGNTYHAPHPPKAFTRKVVLKAAAVYAKDKPEIFAAGWRWKTAKDGSAEAIIGFFFQNGAGKKSNELPQIPKTINLVELFDGEPGDFYGLTTVSTRLVQFRKVCKPAGKKAKKRLTGPILQPGEVIYRSDQNSVGTICAIIKKTTPPYKNKTFILSAMHVLADGNAATTADTVFQPLTTGGSLVKVGRLSIVGQSEAAPITSAQDYALSRITTSRQRRSEIKGLGQPASPTDNILSGQIVAKSGTSSGVTYGRVFYTSVAFSNAATNTFNPDVFGFIVVDRNTNPPMLFEHFATSGDSGAVVAVIDNGEIRPAGLLVSLWDSNMGPGFIALSLTDIMDRVGGELYV